MRISDWSSDVCSSDLVAAGRPGAQHGAAGHVALLDAAALAGQPQAAVGCDAQDVAVAGRDLVVAAPAVPFVAGAVERHAQQTPARTDPAAAAPVLGTREHASVAPAFAPPLAEHPK